ncbi:MAG: tetratricopeptide repeat protein [Sedimentisphaeraceae bacterium JB056]
MKKISCIITLALIVTMIGGCSLFKKDEDKVLNQKLEKTPEQQRLSKIESRLANNFEDSDAHYQLGKIYTFDRLYSKAEYEFSLAIGFDPLNRDAQAAHVKIYKLMGNEQKSSQLAEIYMRQVNSRAEDALLLGRGFQNEGLDDYAIACYEKALTLAPNSAVLNKQIGYYYLNKGDKTRAESYLTRSIQLDPYQADVAGELGKMGVKVEVPRKQSSGLSLDNLFKKKEKEAEAK